MKLYYRQLLAELRAEYWRSLERKGFNTNLPINWTHTFIDKDRSKLTKLYERLKDSGYLLRDLESKGDRWILRVSKIDIISPDNDYQKGIRLEQLTNFSGIEQYCGKVPETMDREGD